MAIHPVQPDPGHGDFARFMCSTHNVRATNDGQPLMTSNITLRLDEKTLRRIKHLAVDRHVSVSAWVSELVTRAVDELDGFEPARRRALEAMRQPAPVREGPLTREQAHER